MVSHDVKRNVSQKRSHTGKKTVKTSPWEVAANQARNQLQDIEEQRKKLMGAIKFFENKIALGEPWPGDEKAGKDTESIPA